MRFDFHVKLDNSAPYIELIIIVSAQIDRCTVYTIYCIFRWKTRDMLNTPNKNSSCITSLLVQLRPWTQYAVFVKTYTTSNTQFGARSKLIYFRTAPSGK